MPALFKPNNDGIEAFAESPAMAAAMLQVAERGADLARENAAQHTITGDFEASISAQLIDGRAMIVAGDEAAVSIEFGTSDTEGIHALGRAAAALST